MYCKHCGKEIANDSKFCSFCGGKIDTNIPAETVRNVQIIPAHIADQPNKSKHANYESPKFKEDKYDPYYLNNNPEAISVGIGALFLALIFFLTTSQTNFITSEINEQILIAIAIFRFIAVWWCVRLAKEKNLHQIIAGGMAFFLPGLWLIVIASSRKLLFPQNYKRKTNPEKSRIDNTIANLYLKNGDYTKAMFYADRALVHSPLNYYAFDTKGQILYNLDDYKGALNNFNESIRLNIGNGVVFYNRACTKHQLNDIKGACEDWKEAYKLGNNSAKEYLEKYCDPKKANI